jgi:hypothetical protein
MSTDPAGRTLCPTRREYSSPPAVRPAPGELAYKSPKYYEASSNVHQFGVLPITIGLRSLTIRVSRLQGRV